VSRDDVNIASRAYCISRRIELLHYTVICV